MLSISAKKLTLLVFAMGLVSWWGTKDGFAQFVTQGTEGGYSSVAVLFAVTASALVQALMAVFLTISLSIYIVRLRTRLLYLMGYATTTAVSVVLAIAFWANFMNLPQDQADSVFVANRDSAIEVALGNASQLTSMREVVVDMRTDARANIEAEAAIPRARHEFWVWMEVWLAAMQTELVSLETELATAIAAAKEAPSPQALQNSLRAPMIAVTESSVTTRMSDRIETAINREATLNDGGGHRGRWAGFESKLQVLAGQVDTFSPAPIPNAQDNPMAGENGAKVYAMLLIEKFLTGAPLTAEERLALGLAITVDLIFAILLILRIESRRPDQDPDLIYHYTPMVEALKARLKRNGFEKGISGVVETLQSNGKGLLGFDRLFGLLVSLPEGASKSQLGQTAAFLTSDGMALNVSGLAVLLSPNGPGSSARAQEAALAQKRRALTIWIPPAQWRLINRLKHVADMMPEPEDKGTLASFMQQQRRKKPRVWTTQKLNTLSKYFGSAMEASLDELVPARIERIVDAYKSDPRARRLTRNTREKHEAIFREAIDTVRNEGLLPNAKIRVAA